MSLSRLLKDIGFKWKTDDPRRGLMELSHIAVKRVEFLRKYIEEKDTALYKFVFIDETWIFQNGTVGRSWQNSDKRSVKTTKVDGKRYIVLHAGNEDGFINGAENIFSSKTQSSDYHGEMNQENFLKWFKNQLLLNLTEPSIIIMDNAPYHSMLLDKCPNNSWKKSDIQDWLVTHNIGFNEQMFKAELLHIVALNKPPTKYIVDDLAEQYGHKVLRLPPYHCIFNPIELIWGIAKQYYNRHIGRDGKSETSCLNMWSEALHSINHEVWKKSIQHTEKEVVSWCNRERVLERREIAPIIIDIGDESDTTDDELYVD
jgi:transposase